VIGLDIRQAQITACASMRPDEVVMDHKVPTDSGVRPGVVASDLHGQSARAMVKAIVAGRAPREALKLASRRLRASREEIF
jgi:hypothetical protein